MESLVRMSIWGSVACWAIALGLLLAGGNRSRARNFWTAGVVLYVFHLASAFHVFHGWSHANAYAETARQTAETTGQNTGFGLWLNYLFGVVWVADTAFWWGGGDERYFCRRRWIIVFLHSFLGFMIFNGSIVFVENPMRWFGVAIFVGLAALWLRARIKRRSATETHAGS